MKRFLVKLLIFVFVAVQVPYIILQAIEPRNLKSWDTPSIILTLPTSRTFDLLIMGTSHAQTFSKNQQVYENVQSILKQSVYSITKAGSGVLIEKVYLDYFYSYNNEAKVVVYFLDPWALYSPLKNENQPGVFNSEPIRYDFSFLLLQNGFNHEIVFSYIKKKFTKEWVSPEYLVSKCKNGFGEETTKDRIAEHYPDGTKSEYFKRYSGQLEEIILLAKKNDSKLVFVLPPVLMSRLPGREETVELLKSYKKKYGISYYDYSFVIKDKRYFADIDHLNCDGVVYFTKNYLKKILK